MQVKLLAALSGTKGSFMPGEFYECGAKEGARLIEAGFAEAVAGKAERAVKVPRAATRDA